MPALVEPEFWNNMKYLLAKGKEKKAVLNNLDVNKHPIAKLLPQIFKIIN